MRHPPSLNKGDKIAIVAPARSITFEEVLPTMKLFQKWGLEVVLGTHIFSKENQFAGSDYQRRADLQQMLDDPSIRAIMCACGGYGTVRIIDQLDFTGFCRDPKWIAGFSDITVLHAHVHKHFGIETVHSVMPVNIKATDPENDSAGSLKKVLFGENLFYSKPVTFGLNPGLSEGMLAGGNLSILYSLMGTLSEPETDEMILLIEDVDEYLYHVDRMMMNLKRAGKLEKLKGMIVGSMERMRDNDTPYGKTAREIITDAVEEYGYPVCFDFPAGHGELNLAMILGRKIRFSLTEKNMEIEFNG